MTTNNINTKPQEANAEEAASYVLKHYYKENILPINPELVAENMNIKVFYDDLSVDGALFKKLNSNPLIYVDNKMPINRQRFTIAHELGHYVDRILNSDIHYKNQSMDEMEFIDKRDSISKQGKDRAEIFANKFAASLLMPKDEIIKATHQKIDVATLASIFNVSTEAMYIRMRNLKLI